MAATKASKKSAIERLTPNAITVRVNGEDVRVATSREEDQIMNMFLAARIRNVLNKTMDDYKNDEVKLTPKEIRDLAAAARDIATFSAEVYAAAEPIKDSPKPTEAPDATEINFETLHNVPEVIEPETSSDDRTT
jgi:hypothetical protein